MFLNAHDTISGAEARAFATIDGNNEEMFYLKKLKATVKKEKTPVPVLGKRAVQQKAAGWEGTGECTIYYVTPLFRKMMLDYIKTGKDAYFDITLVNEDPNSSIGKQTVILKNVNLNETVMALIDVEAKTLEEEVSFTFSDIDMPDKFNAPTSN